MRDHTWLQGGLLYTDLVRRLDPVPVVGDFLQCSAVVYKAFPGCGQKGKPGLKCQSVPLYLWLVSRHAHAGLFLEGLLRFF